MTFDLDICMCNNSKCTKRKMCYRALCDTQAFKDFINEEEYRYYSMSDFENCIEQDYRYFLNKKTFN